MKFCKKFKEQSQTFLKNFLKLLRKFLKRLLIVKMLRCDEILMEIRGNSTKKRNLQKSDCRHDNACTCFANVTKISGGN